MSRASNANATNGSPYENVQAFVKARLTSKIAGLKGDIRNGLWTNADNEKKFDLSQPLQRPFDPSKVKVEEPSTEESA
jgi:hypothetical protein